MEKFCTILIQSLVLLNEHKDILPPFLFCPPVFRSNLMSATKYTVKKLHHTFNSKFVFIFKYVQFVLFIDLIFLCARAFSKNLSHIWINFVALFIYFEQCIGAPFLFSLHCSPPPPPGPKAISDGGKSNFEDFCREDRRTATRRIPQS